MWWQRDPVCLRGDQGREQRPRLPDRAEDGRPRRRRPVSELRVRPGRVAPRHGAQNVHGDIFTRYAQLGGTAVGYPVIDEGGTRWPRPLQPLPDLANGGERSIYWTVEAWRSPSVCCNITVAVTIDNASSTPSSHSTKLHARDSPPHCRSSPPTLPPGDRCPAARTRRHRQERADR